MAEARNAFRTLIKEAPEKLQLRIQQLLDSLVFKDELSTTKTELEAGQADQGAYVHIASADTITAKHTFAPAAATAPFALGSNALAQLVTGLNADYLDSQHGSYYLNASNINAGTLAVSYGGTGLNSLATGLIPYGAGTSAFGSAATFIYSSGKLGIGTAGPDRALDVLDASNPQIRLTQADGTVYVDLKTDSSGNLNVLPSGTTVTIGSGASGVDYILQFNGETADGVLTWMEDEDYFKFSDCVRTEGGRKINTTTQVDTYIVLATDELVVCNKAAAFTVTLPVASGSGRKVYIQNINTGTVTLEGDTADTIDGNLNISILQWESAQVVDYAANKWVIV